MSKSNTKGSNNTLIILLAILLVAVIACGIITHGFKDWTPCACFGHKYDDNGVCVRCKAEKPADGEEPPKDNAVISSGESNGIMLASAKLLNSQYEENGISPQAESAYTLTATINPSNATYTDVEWTAAFKNPSSAWANGKNVSDYVTLNTNGLSATISCKQAFGEQIIIIVTSMDDSTKSASATVDYRKRVTDASVSLKPTSGNAITLGKSASTVSATIATNTSYTVTVNVTESIGTIASGYVVKDSQAALIENFFTIINTSGEHMEPESRLNTRRVESSINIGRSDFQMMLAVDDWACDMEYEDEYTDRVISAMAKIGTNKNLGRWHLLLADASGTTLLDKTFYFAINISSLRTAVSSVSLNNTSFVF